MNPGWEVRPLGWLLLVLLVLLVGMVLYYTVAWLTPPRKDDPQTH